MSKNWKIMTLIVAVTGSAYLSACQTTGSAVKTTTTSTPEVKTTNIVVSPPPKKLIRISDIDTFTPAATSKQALEVIGNNHFSEKFYEEVFEKVVDNLKENKKKDNAEIIWDELINPLKKSGKIPPDLAVRTWNYYFSNDFVSLPTVGSVDSHCSELASVKTNLHKEYQAKKKGFEICNFGSPDTNYLNAMYVYNTMWASCNPPD